MKDASVYIQDLSVGDTWSSQPVVVSESDIVEFAGSYDPQPFHLDPEAARSGPFGGLVASGWHLAALVMKLTVEAQPYGKTPIVGAGVDELRWLRPVRPGDQLTLEREVIDIRMPSANPGRGTVRSLTRLRNQNAEVVMTMITITKIPTRPAIATPVAP
jgi:acyl dehydratase